MKKLLIALGLVIGMAQPGLTAAYYCSSYDCCESDCCIDWCNGWKIYGDYLYWNVRKCNLDYAVRAEEFSEDDFEFSLLRGDLQTVDPTYSSGFRIGIAKTFCNWDLGVRYTYLRPDDKDSFSLSGGDSALPTRLMFGILDDDLETAEARYKVDLDVFDIEAGHEYQPWCNTALRFFGGVKIARIDQDLNIDMAGEDFDDNDAFVRQKSRIDMDAYGLYLGARGTHNFWDFCCGKGIFGVFGDFSAGGLVGDVDRKLETQGDFINESITVTDLRDDCWRLVGNFNFAAGLSLMVCDCFCGNFSLSVGYEMNLWVNTADFLGMNASSLLIEENGVGEDPFAKNVSTVRNQDTLGFDGLVVRAALEF